MLSIYLGRHDALVESLREQVGEFLGPSLSENMAKAAFRTSDNL